MGKAETGQYNSFQRRALCWPHCALLETTLTPTIHLNPTCNKSLMLIKAFFFSGLDYWELLSIVAWRSHTPLMAGCPLSPPSDNRLNCLESWWVPAGGCSPGASQCCFLWFFHHIWLLPANSRRGREGEERDAKGFTVARAKGQSVPAMRLRAGARAEKAFPLVRLFMYREHNK